MKNIRRAMEIAFNGQGMRTGSILYDRRIGDEVHNSVYRVMWWSLGRENLDLRDLGRLSIRGRFKK